MQRLRIVAAGVALVLSAFSVEARAQDYAWPGFYLAAAFTYGIENFDDETSEGSEINDVDFENGAGFNLRAGNRLNRWIAIEAEFEWIDDFDTSIVIDGEAFDAEIEVWTLMANVRGYPLTGRVQPFGLFGMGFSTVDLNASGDSVDEVDFGMRAGGGFEVYLSEYLAVTLEGGYVISFGDLDGLDYATASAGLLFRM